MVARQFFQRRCTCQRRGDKTVRHQLADLYEGPVMSKSQTVHTYRACLLMPTHATLFVPNVWHTTTYVVSKLLPTLVARLGKKSCT
jgi:hypothetical protein